MAFCYNFQGTFVEPVTAGSLFAIKQLPEQSLQDYFRRFTAAKSQIRRLSDSTIIDTAKQGVLEGTEFFSKLMDKFEEYARGEEENMWPGACPAAPTRDGGARGFNCGWDAASASTCSAGSNPGTRSGCGRSQSSLRPASRPG